MLTAELPGAQQGGLVQRSTSKRSPMLAAARLHQEGSCAQHLLIAAMTIAGRQSADGRTRQRGRPFHQHACFGRAGVAGPGRMATAAGERRSRRLARDAAVPAERARRGLRLGRAKRGLARPARWRRKWLALARYLAAAVQKQRYLRQPRRTRTATAAASSRASCLSCRGRLNLAGPIYRLTSNCPFPATGTAYKSPRSPLALLLRGSMRQPMAMHVKLCYK